MSFEVKIEPDANELTTELHFLNMRETITFLAEKHPTVRIMLHKMEEEFGCQWRGATHYNKLIIDPDAKTATLTDSCFKQNPKQIKFDGTIVGLINNEGLFMSNTKAGELIEANEQGFASLPFRHLDREIQFTSMAEEILNLANLMEEIGTTIFSLSLVGFGGGIEEVLLAAN